MIRATRGVLALLLLIVISGLMPRGLRAEDTNGVWQLLREAEVDSTGIFLNQLVIAPPGTTLPQIRLGPAPALGQAVGVSRRQVTELARKHDPDLVLTNWTGPAVVRVCRRTRLFSESEVIQMVTTEIQREYVKSRGELELHLTSPFVTVRVPDEPLTLKVSEMPATGVLPAFVVRCELWHAKERLGDWLLPVVASVWHDVPLARSPLSRGQSLKDADVTQERRDVLAARDVLLELPADPGAFELTENIPAGMPLQNRSIRTRPLIQRGRLVEAVYDAGALKISLKVETLEDGMLGQTVRVRNPKTRRELSGKVQNEQTVFITL